MVNVNPKANAVDEEEQSPWETESGLIDDVDAWIANSHFGKKAEYAQKVALSENADDTSGNMILFDLVDIDGEVLATQGYSVGSGWTVSEDGFFITHPKRKNVVRNTIFGQLQDFVRGENGLNIPLEVFGIPTDSRSWNGLGFHWNLKGHATLVKGEEKQGLMPSIWLGVAMKFRDPAPEGFEEVSEDMLYIEGEEPTEETVEEAAPAPKAAPAVKKAAPATAAKPGKKESPLEARLKTLAKESKSQKEFMIKAVKIDGVPADDDLMAKVSSDGPEGFYGMYHNG